MTYFPQYVPRATRGDFTSRRQEGRNRIRGGRGTYCGNNGIAYVVLFTDFGQSSLLSYYLMLKVRQNATNSCSVFL